jgi:MatE
MTVATYGDVLAIERAPLAERNIPPTPYDMLRAGSAIARDSPALTFFAETSRFKEATVWSHRELFRRITQAGNLFRRLGVERCDAVAFIISTERVIDKRLKLEPIPMTDSAVLAPPVAAPAPPVELSTRTLLLLNGPIVPTLLRLAWPNALVMVAQASTGLIETFLVSRLGTDALAGMALVFPGVMMMTMLSAGAVGGGISSAVARALGSGRRADANALVLHALLINLALGLLTSALFLVFGRRIYAAMGGRGGSLDAAMAYSNVVFAGNVVLWLMNALASVIRGSGEMLFRSTIVCIGVALLIPLSPLFILGLGPFPAMGTSAVGSFWSGMRRSRHWVEAQCACSS